MREIQGHECVEIMKNVEVRRKRLLIDRLSNSEQYRIDRGDVDSPRWLGWGLLLLVGYIIAWILIMNETNKDMVDIYDGVNKCYTRCHHPDLTTGKKYGNYWDTVNGRKK